MNIMKGTLLENLMLIWFLYGTALALLCIDAPMMFSLLELSSPIMTALRIGIVFCGLMFAILTLCVSYFATMHFWTIQRNRARSTIG